MEISFNHQFGTLEIFADEFSSPLSGAFETGWKSFPAGDPLSGIHAGVPSNILAAGGSPLSVSFDTGMEVFRYRWKTSRVFPGWAGNVLSYIQPARISFGLTVSPD